MKTIAFVFLFLCLVLFAIHVTAYACDKPDPSIDPAGELLTSFNGNPSLDAFGANSFWDFTCQSLNQTRSDDSHNCYAALFETSPSSSTVTGGQEQMTVMETVRTLGPIIVNTLVLWILIR